VSATGPLALVGGNEWTSGCDFDEQLWESAGRPEVLILPTAAAYEHPQRAVEVGVEHFRGFGATARGLPVLSRRDAEDPNLAAEIRSARFVYLGSGSALHLRSVLKGSQVWSSIVDAWHAGAVVAGSAAGAMVLGDPMVDPRGGALTLGLGMISQIAVVPNANTWSPEQALRTVRLATGHLRILAIDDATAAIADTEGSWSIAGVGGVTVYADGSQVALGELPTLV
jgi:cyanophycinase